MKPLHVLAVAFLAWPFAAHGGDDKLCGRSSGAISERVIEMQKPEVEGLYRDARIMVFRDPTDSTMWVFSLKNTSAHPAVLCVKSGASADEPGNTGLDCAASEKICKSFEDSARAQIAKLSAAPAK